MPTNFNPIQSAVKIRGRPLEHEALIMRQGQLVRILQARLCPCVTNGKSALDCNLCKGRGYILSFQKEMEVIEETSRHCNICPTEQKAKVFTWWQPIIKAIRVQRYLHPAQGGSVIYPILYSDFESITVATTGHPLKAYYQVRASYAYKLSDVITNENSDHDGSYIVKVIGTAYVNNDETSNAFDIKGDITKVNRVYNVTTDHTYSVVGFNKQSIYIDPNDLNPPLSTDVLQVDYEWISPVKAVTSRIESEYALQKWGEDIRLGDVEVVIPGGWNISRGDVFTFYSSLAKGQVVIKRGSLPYDELPEFDVYDILENIQDIDGNIYTSSDFQLQNYNQLLWTGANKPAQGKNYSVIYRAHPSYIVYKKGQSLMNAEDKVFPQNLYLRMTSKLTVQNLVAAVI